MKCVRLYPNSDRPKPLLPVGPFPFLVGRDLVVVAAVRNTEVLKQVVILEGLITFNIDNLEDLERAMIGAGTCLPDGRVIDWCDDLRAVTTPMWAREAVAEALRVEFSHHVDMTRPGFLELLAALWAAEEEEEELEKRKATKPPSTGS